MTHNLNIRLTTKSNDLLIVFLQVLYLFQCYLLHLLCRLSLAFLKGALHVLFGSLFLQEVLL